MYIGVPNLKQCVAERLDVPGAGDFEIRRDVVYYSV
jgi:hypothetical protein